MRPAQDNQGSFLGRISIRRNQFTDVNTEQEQEDLELFQKHIADRFTELLTPPPPPQPPSEQIMSVTWLRKLMDVFLCCEAEFKAILLMGRDPTQISKPPFDRLVPEMLDRSIKALDICTAVVNGIDSVRHYQRLAEIAVAALEQRPLGDGNVRRAKRALANLLIALSIEDKENVSSGGGGNKTVERSWSFGRRGGGSSAASKGGATIGRNWSAAKQIHAMTANLTPPRGNEAAGLPLPMFIMSTVTVFVMWVLTAAVPCQERAGLANHLPVPKHLNWAQSLVGIHEKIGDEWKKKEKKGSAGLMEEMTRMEKLGHSLIEFADGFHYPAEKEAAESAAAQVAEMAEICRRMEEELVPLQQQIREVFHRIVRSRAEILEVLEQAGKLSAPVV
ncbi:hypothetical protein F2Q70_00002771 [Brassica cretica]|uniref:R3H domain-containing protein n=1 Tax=Brassica cretica TaxID=69181 RepID=A0A8S9J5C2_BRACR|nr:hypothetical protein F2Q70_00002771 [Brassica cretica]